ncbi:MG2 domain-containing protein [Pirellulales bacterium]|nr:MG2 domain-containing protein [Pirellulales bacterium]
MFRRLTILMLCITSAGVTAALGLADSPDESSLRRQARALYREGNYQDALAKFRTLTLEIEQPDSAEAARDLHSAADCYQRLNKVPEVDAYLEAVTKRHTNDWQILFAAAQRVSGLPHYGALIAGEFERGQHRGGGQWVSSERRDRVRALQLYQQAFQIVADNPTIQKAPMAASLIGRFAHDFQRHGGEAWRMQLLTDLVTLPDYGENQVHGWQGGQGAPVDADGEPVYYNEPESWESAKNDGERWRWLLAERSRWQPARKSQELLDRAGFLSSQFGVQTIASHHWISRAPGDGDEPSHAFELHTLKDTETIARLADGIRRFELPDEHNHIALAQRVRTSAADKQGDWEQATSRLGGWMQNRRQFPRAAELLRELIAAGRENYQSQLDQIVGNWGTLEPVASQPAGGGATIQLRFRNATEVGFTAREIDVEKLLADMKKHLESGPQKIDGRLLQLEKLGYRLVHEGQDKYLGKEVARWSVELKPRENHFDRRVAITTPLQESGAYLLTAKLKDGNEQSVVVWVTDTAIVKKQLDGKALYYVADALTGQPLPGCNVEFFGFWHEQPKPKQLIVHTKSFSETTDKQGMVRMAADESGRRHRWIVTARKDKGRFAFLGFSRVWHSNYHDPRYNQVKCFAITDRPVYRPGHEVQFKFWVRHARYDSPMESQFANQAFQVEIRNPKNESVYSESLTADAYGGIASTWTLPDDAALGSYQLYVVNHGGGSFRVEEYKKPEFEVTIEAPEEPVMLGEKVTATIRANYYFGAPVAEATVRYKVLRTPYSERWFPRQPWDWMYGPGYGWFAPAYDWYPGFSRWGCFGPWPWWNGRPSSPPELVAQQQLPIGPDGTVTFEIDTALAKQIHSDQDHRYRIEAEVVDQSRRTVVAAGQVLVARKPFEVTLWTHRGFYQSGQTIEVHAAARTLAGKPVSGNGKLRLLAISYQDGKPHEHEAASWDLATDEQGRANLQITAAESGQYRLAYKMTDAEGREIEGGQIVTIRGERFTGEDFRFDNIEIVPDRREYAPGDKVSLQISTDRAGAAVLLFLRPSSGVYLAPKLITMRGKSTVVKFDVTAKDMPNFFVEAVTVHGGQMHATVREIFVPPANRVLNVEVVPSADAYLPGQSASARIKITNAKGEPFVGSTVVAIYDKALDYIADGGNVADIKEFFWKWRRHHNPHGETNLTRVERPQQPRDQPGMQPLGIFGSTIADGEDSTNFHRQSFLMKGRALGRHMEGDSMPAPMAAAEVAEGAPGSFDDDSDAKSGAESLVDPTVRQEFADTALWIAALETNSDGIADIKLDMPDNLTAWKINVWGMGHGTRVGQGSAEVVTRKNIIVRLQAPRFFVETDEVVLSANVHNYLSVEKDVRVRLELDGPTQEGPTQEGPTLEGPAELTTTVRIPAGGEKRVDWRVDVRREGEATIRMIAQTDEESDAMQMQFPVFVHGMLKTESYAGMIRPDDNRGSFDFTIPGVRKPDQSRLEIRFTPTLAGAMLDALPYLADYPYGCTEQTLNRFLPSVITQRTLQRMGVDLAAFKEKQTNLNAQEIGDDSARSEEWKRLRVDPVFDEHELAKRVKAGVNRLIEMQLSDGGWGWFSGYGERSSPHTTAVVVRGLLIALQNDVAIVPGTVESGVKWLERYQQQQLAELDNWDREEKKRRDESRPAKSRADNLDALVYLVLAEAGQKNDAMRDYLYQDRTHLAVYSLATYGLALHQQNEHDKLAMVMRNLNQYVEQDDENQTAWLNLPGGYWWHWYGSEYEAHAYYLKLLVAENPKNEVAPRLVKYLLNNRKHATYWNSTRDTALVVEAFADYLEATGEAKPDLQLDILIDGKVAKQATVTPENLFAFDNKLVIEGLDLETGVHTVEFRKRGTSPLYFNGYVTNFTLEDPITAAGLEIKIARRYFRLVPREQTAAVAGDRGQVVGQRVEKYDREELVNLEEVVSGDLIEVELVIESKNDYEYILVEDKKPAGCEPVEVRSGYTGNEMGAYVEFRDDRTSLLVARLARGRHSVSYRLRAETPGKFSALPAVASAMYAPELKANSDEFKIRILDLTE